MVRYCPLFGLRVPYPHFSGRKGEEFAVTCSQQRWSEETKLLGYKTIVFGRGSARDLSGRAHDALRPGWRGDTSSPFSSPHVSRPKGVSLSFWIATPHLDQSYSTEWQENGQIYTFCFPGNAKTPVRWGVLETKPPLQAKIYHLKYSQNKKKQSMFDYRPLYADDGRGCFVTHGRCILKYVSQVGVVFLWKKCRK